jgi:hypothetical protein
MAARERKTPADEAVEQHAREKADLQAELERVSGIRFEGGYLDLAFALLKLRYEAPRD